MPDNGQEDGRAHFEERLYRSSLKQVVDFLNTTLPPLSDTEESSHSATEEIKEKKPVKIKKLGIYKVRDTKKKTKALMQEAGEYSTFDVEPTRIRKSLKKEDPNAKKKRFNKFSELKYNDMVKKRKDLRAFKKRKSK